MNGANLRGLKRNEPLKEKRIHQELIFKNVLFVAPM